MRGREGERESDSSRSVGRLKFRSIFCPFSSANRVFPLRPPPLSLSHCSFSPSVERARVRIYFQFRQFLASVPRETQPFSPTPIPHALSLDALGSPDWRPTFSFSLSLSFTLSLPFSLPCSMYVRATCPHHPSSSHPSSLIHYLALSSSLPFSPSLSRSFSANRPAARPIFLSISRAFTPSKRVRPGVY